MIEITWHAPLLDTAALVNIHCSGEVGIFYSDDMAAMRGVVASLCNKYLFLLGYVTKGDSLGGEYYWDRTSTAVDDAVTVINPTGNAGVGRWIKRL